MKYKIWFLFLLILCLWQTPDPTYILDRDDAIVVKVSSKFLSELPIAPMQIGALTLAPFIFIDEKQQWNSTFQNHEFVHFAQQKRDGGFFYVKYWGYYLYNLTKYSWEFRYLENTFKSAASWSYYMIPYEKEAFCKAERKLCNN